jgi:hypothetical protein
MREFLAGARSIVSPPCDRFHRAPRFLSLQMRIALYSVCTVLALVTGCMSDDAIFLQGDVPSFGQAGANDTDCDLDVNGEPPAVERDARTAISPSTGITTRIRAGVGSAQPSAFNTSGCEVRGPD